jgi:hypothetical protein
MGDSTGQSIIVTSWLIMAGGAVPLLAGISAVQNGNNDDWLFSPFIIQEGLGLTLNGIGTQLDTAKNASSRDKLNVAGRILLGLGLISLGGTAFVPITNRLIPRLVTGSLMLSGSLCLGLAEDKANLLKWS